MTVGEKSRMLAIIKKELEKKLFIYHFTKPIFFMHAWKSLFCFGHQSSKKAVTFKVTVLSL